VGILNDCHLKCSYNFVHSSQPRFLSRNNNTPQTLLIRNLALRYTFTMVETHPFGDFVPKKTKYLMLGSFVTKPSNPYDWFYANGRNQFWPIMAGVYGLEFDTKEKQQQLFIQLEMALTDIILSCERRSNSNLDINLFNIIYNTAIKDIIPNHAVQKIFFTSRYVETLFRRHFKDVIQLRPDVELVCLPSPSPRYAMMSKQEKIGRYKELLPTLESN